MRPAGTSGKSYFRLGKILKVHKVKLIKNVMRNDGTLEHSKMCPIMQSVGPIMLCLAL